MFLSADRKQIFDPRFARFRSERNVKSEIGSVTLVADEGMLSAVLRDIFLAFCIFSNFKLKVSILILLGNRREGSQVNI